LEIIIDLPFGFPINNIISLLATEGNDAEGDCVLCNQGKYSSNTSAISEDTCQNCPLNYDYSLAGSGLVSACSPPTPLPWWICPCKESNWREFWDPQHTVMWIRMVVALPYQSVTYTYTKQTHTHWAGKNVARE